MRAMTERQRRALGESHSLVDLGAHAHRQTVDALIRRGFARRSRVGDDVEVHLTNEGRDERTRILAWVDGALADRGYFPCDLRGNYTRETGYGIVSRAVAMEETGVKW